MDGSDGWDGHKSVVTSTSVLNCTVASFVDRITPTLEWGLECVVDVVVGRCLAVVSEFCTARRSLFAFGKAWLVLVDSIEVERKDTHCRRSSNWFP